MFHWLSTTRVIATVAVLILGAGCASAPTQAPVGGGSADTGAGPVDAVRRQLQGTWDLVSLAVTPAAGAAPVAVAAQGTLTYDRNGKLTIEARTSDSYAPEAAQSGGVLAFEGTAVIDAAKGELKLSDPTGNVDPNAALSPEQRRRFAFEGELLRLSSFDAAGKVTATSTWRRQASR
jgi:hypothetical protein